MFLKNKPKENSQIKPEPKKCESEKKEIVEAWSLQTKDYYWKMNDESTKSLANIVLNKCIKDKVILKEKIWNKIFLLGSNLKNKYLGEKLI